MRPRLAGRDLECRELVELVSAWLDRELGRRTARRVRRHLRGCADCREYAAQVGLVIAALRRPDRGRPAT